MNKSANKITKPRVLIIHNIISPYRLPLFEGISKKTDLTVLFCRARTKDRSWKYNLSEYSFRYIISKSFLLGPAIINFGVLVHLVKSKFDIVVVSNDPDVAFSAVPAIVYAKIMRKKIINWSQVTDLRVHSIEHSPRTNSLISTMSIRIVRKIIKTYRSLVINNSDMYFAIGDKAKRYLIDNHAVPSSEIISSINIMPSSLLPSAKLSTRHKGKTVLYIGYLNDRKGLPLLINAFSALHGKDLRLIIAGTGPLLQDLSSLASNDPRITFSGYVEGVDKANLYASADVFVLPTQHDVWGLTINEAIHYGLAVICSDAAGAVEIIDDETGIIFPVNDKTALTKAIKTLTIDRTKTEMIRRNNLKRTDITDTNIMVDSFVSAVNRVYDYDC